MNDALADEEFCAAAQRNQREPLVHVRCAQCRTRAGTVFDTAVGPMLITWKPLGGGLTPILRELSDELIGTGQIPETPSRRVAARVAEDTRFYVVENDHTIQLGIAPSQMRPGVIHCGYPTEMLVRCPRHGCRQVNTTAVGRAVAKARGRHRAVEIVA